MSDIKKFIKDNKLDFSSAGSALNSNCTILAGYALHLGLELGEVDPEEEIIPDADAWSEFERVFNYAEANGYGAYWTSKDAKERYIF